MKFYGHGIVWDADKDKPLCEFKDGVFETKTKRTIDKLTALGYENDGATADTPPDEPPTTE